MVSPGSRRWTRRRFIGAAGASLLTASCAGQGRGLVLPSDQAVAEREARRLSSDSSTIRVRLVAGSQTVDLGGRSASTWTFGSLPGPRISARAGDVVEATVTNQLPESLSIHWHGVALRNDMDGVQDLTQPAIAPGAEFVYRFVVSDPGTYWFHPHTGLQLDRGLYAPLIIDDPGEPLSVDVDETLIFDDWLDGLGATPDTVFTGLLERGMDMSGMGGMPMSTSAALGGDAGDVDYPLHLVNGRPPNDRPTFTAAPGARIRLRLINAGSDTAYRFAVSGHSLTVTHADGFPVEAVSVDTLLIGMGERYDVVLTLRPGVWAIVAVAEGKGGAAAALLRSRGTDATQAPPSDARPVELGGRLLRYDQLNAAPDVRLPMGEPDRTKLIALTGDMATYTWGLDGRSFAEQHPIEVEQGERVRLVLQNQTTMWHPMHLHGHTFRMGSTEAGPRKDTVNVLPGSQLSIDFQADNPGQWMLHCHNTYHLESGMATVVSYVR